MTYLFELLEHAQYQIKTFYEGGGQIHLTHALNDIMDILQELIKKEESRT